MVKYSYFPGCTLSTHAKKLDRYARVCAEKLDFELDEIPEWQCCGAVYPNVRDEIASRLSSVRALDSAKGSGLDLITVCSACYHVIKRVNNDMKNDDEINSKVNNYLALPDKYNGETKVLHYLEVLRDGIGFSKVKEMTTNPLLGMKIAPYYGCLLLRPSKEMAFDDPENPSIMEDLISSLGGEPVYYAMRNECCGGYTTIERKELAAKQAQKIMDNAISAGADCLITACPLCMYNLSKNTNDGIPVYYFTELLAKALGVEDGDQIEK